MVTKTFRCDLCDREYDLEMPMDQVQALCPVHDKWMKRVFNHITVTRPGADSRGFFGNGFSSPKELK